jgi:hypothetical protein
MLLSRIADSVSGNCTKAISTKEVMNALSESCMLLSEGKSSSVEVRVDCDYAVFMCKSPQKVIGSDRDFTIKGVGESDYILLKFSETELDADAIADDAMCVTAAYGMAKSKLSSGNINEAKMAMMASMNRTLTESHIRALTPSQLGDMSSALENAIFSRSDDEFFTGPEEFVSNGPSIIDIVKVLDENRNDILLNINKFRESYRKRGLEKVAGKREKDGTVTIPPVDTKIIETGDFVRMGSFEINRDTATVNMQIERGVNLVERDSGKVITEVAGVILDSLKDYKKYTIVGDGELNAKSMTVRFSTEKAFEEMQNIGIFSECEYSHSGEYEIRLFDFPVCPLLSEAEISTDTFETLAKLNIFGRILNGLSKGKSSKYSPEQIEELKSYCLSDSLHINIPMMNKHDNLDDAIADGSVDSRTSYKITIGSTEILNVSNFKSANQFFDRMYVAERVDDNGNVVETISKPNIGDIFFDKKVRISHKTLSARTKVTKADDLQKFIYDEFFDLGKPDFLKEIGAIIGVPEIAEIGWRHSVGEKESTKTVEKAQKAVAIKEREMWANLVSPIVFHIGSTGILPDGIDAVAMTAEEIMERYPDLKMAKAEKEGTFFDVDGVIISVYAENKYVSVDKSEREKADVQEAVATA